MASQYILVDKTILPKCYEKVVLAKELLINGKVENVTEACKKTGISRSTFYKYQEYVYNYTKGTNGQKIVLSLKLLHRTGALSKFCNELSKLGASILTMSQSLPINDSASIMVSCDISKLNIEISDIKRTLEKNPDVSKVEILALDN